MPAAEDHRRESRQRWSRTAAGWEAQAAVMAQASMPVSIWMVEAIDPQPGHVVLELAAGPGDTGFLAAELIRPGGTLITSDFVPEMLTAAQHRAAALGIDNVRFRQIDAELPIDQPAASVDAVLCRWGYMLLADPEAALRETRRILRTDGRLALAAWTGPKDNLWSTVPVGELTRRGLLERVDPDAPGQFAWAREGAIEEHLEAAGFVATAVDTIGFTMRYASVEAWWAAQQQLSVRVEEAAARLDPATEAEVLEALREAAAPFAAADGSLAIPARTWVAAATP